jgi:hypothetical protein
MDALTQAAKFILKSFFVARAEKGMLHDVLVLHFFSCGWMQDCIHHWAVRRMIVFK